MSGSYDLVVIDTPPILAVTDAAIVGQHAGISLMVVRFRETSLQSVISAEERFRINGIDIKGVIFNAVDVKFSRYYGAYNYYDYSYESDTSKY